MKKTISIAWSGGPGKFVHRLHKPVRLIVLFLLVGLISEQVYSSGPKDDQQQIRITGTVTDSETGNPMPGVNIQVKGATIGTITDADGKYSINVTDKNAILVFSFIGYTTKEVPVAGQTVVDITMSPTLTDLDEVVVVGYSTQKKANVIGSVTSLPGTTIRSIPSPNVATALSGRLPGSIIIQLNDEPGQNTTRVLVRGRSTLGGSRASYANETAPLVIIDGVPGRNMNEIDPNDIETLSVLKDASAAIYGAQAANGVILITTKKGSEGKPRLNYQFYQGFMTPTLIPEVCDAAEYATMLSEYQVATKKTRTYSDRDIELFRSGEDPWEHPNTNWYNDLIKDWTGTMRHNLSIDGGFRGMTYYLSAGYKTDDAFYKESSTKYTQYNVRAKVDLPITDWLKVGTELSGFQINRVYPYKSADAIVGQSTRLVPTTWSYWPNGLPGPDIEYGDNPVVTSTFAGGKDDQNTYKVLTTFSGTITVPFIKGLSFNANYSYDLTNFYRKRFFKPWILYYPNWSAATRDPNTGFVVDMPVIPTPRGLSYPRNTENYSRTINNTFLFSANYTRTFGNHNISLYGGFEQYTNDYNDLEGFRDYYISDLIQTMSAGGDQDKNTTGGRSIYARKSYIGRATYDYLGKYLAEIVFRADGSLKFPPDNRWGYFPGFLLGWRASEEGFWKDNISFINYFKLKASYGEMGMDPGNPFQYMNSFSLSSGMVFGTGSAIETCVGPPTMANPSITWEKQTTRNIGFESKLFRDLLHLNFEYFYNIRKDILATRNASVPSFTGLSLPQENIARVDNRGFEIEAGVHKNITPDLRIDFGGNFSYNHNEVVFMDEPPRPVPWQKMEGHPYNAWLMYRAIGIFEDSTFTVNGVENYPHWTNAQPGDVIFEDVSGDGKIDGNDRILVDEVDVPETFYGINLDATWKNFKLTVLIQGQGKFYKFNHYDERRGEAGNYFKWTYDNRWTPTNTKTDIARAFNRNDFYWAHSVNMSTYWLDNTAYCRLKNVVLNYTIPSSIFKGIGISQASVYFSGTNLALLYSATKKFDPEINGQGVYPLMKTFAFGANITF
ncbi:MAG TPA: TonB-dependent receptor [Bacteroidales bacterium]|mgnify:CR=1 FL=1|nr:TonB-dependent receptor [Bacteroidales bacterium]HQG37259.1 TonB-dependent receptor [Bacteroidales bacterium]HQG53722.1 TonB-dependent receptor [Bacteroidales bacterium]HQJ21351.1 TonB-dependent receptor [Bacteroidales bacterium]